MKKKVIDILPPKTSTPFYEGKKGKVSLEIYDDFKNKNGRGKKIHSKRFFKGLVFAFGILILIGVFGLIILPQAEIIIWPKTEILEFETILTIDKEADQIDFLTKIIPGHFFEIEKTESQRFISSGEVEKKAKGVIRVYNTHNRSITLRPNTRFQPPLENLLYFHSLKKVTIPAKGHIDINVIASQPGKEYNINPTKFSVPGLAGTDLFFKIHGESFLSMKGGGKVIYVIEQDLEKAKDSLVQKAFIKAEAFLKNQMNNAVPEFVLLKEASKSEVLEYSSLAKAGDEVESFISEVKIRRQALIFKKQDLESFAKEFIFNQIQDGKTLHEEGLQINYSLDLMDFPRKIVLNLELSAEIYSAFEQEALKRELKRKSLRQAQNFLENQTQISRVQINLWPFWTRRIPNNPEKIKIQLKF